MLPVTCLIVFVIVLNLNNITAANVAKMSDLPIQFPEPVRQVADDDHVPASCRSLTYCTVKPANYPEEKFNQMFKDHKPVQLPELVVEFTNKAGDDDDDNCKSEETFEPLYQVRQKRDKIWRTVVQAPGHDYVQRVRLETCSNVNAPCFESFCMASEYKAVCKQNYNTWKVVVDKGDNGTETIEATLPVSCSCTAVKG
ncbi:uncharacterized protein [Maniola hyperantus]|uniref:uncharacterized protein n=1 Tax=Aphantopus hyperantus TaxID=2795564 RepID=UPI00156A1156|nr:uncharacterized protein LOC117986797 [Maniola hyperantus]